MPNTATARTCSDTDGWNEPSRGTTVEPELPGKRPAAVASVPVTTSTPTAASSTPPSRARARQRGAPPRTSRVASSSDEHAEAEHGEREQQVRDHEPRVEVVVDGDRAERRLPERAGEDDPREDLHAAAEPARAERRDGEHERREDREERDDAVRELDVRVVALRGETDASVWQPASAGSRGPSR